MTISSTTKKPFNALAEEHRQAQLLCQRIREGVRLRIDPGRIMRYANWYFINHLSPHFEKEQEYIFPILGSDHVQVKKALSAHRRLTRLFTSHEQAERCLSRIEEELDFLVRFEEKNLFAEVKTKMTAEQRLNVQEIKLETFTEDWEDEFWHN